MKHRGIETATVIVVLAGVKPLFVIWTVFVSAPAAVATSIAASNASGSRSMRFIMRLPPSLLPLSRAAGPPNRETAEFHSFQTASSLSAHAESSGCRCARRAARFRPG